VGGLQAVIQVPIAPVADYSRAALGDQCAWLKISDPGARIKAV
jgi:hypothetical protein